MADVALRPTFPNDELQRLRAERLTNMIQAPRRSGDDRASWPSPAFSTAPATATAPRRPAPRETIQSFTADDLRAFYTSMFRPDNAALIVVGDVTADRVVPLLETNFGGWKAPGRGPAAHRAADAADARGAPDLPRRQTRRRAVADSHRLGRRSALHAGLLPHPGDEHDPRRIVLLAAEPQPARETRLHLRRDRRSSTCGAAGPFVAAAGVQTDKTADALKEFFNELTAILQARARRRARAREALRVAPLSLRFETTGDISRRLEDALVYRLPGRLFRDIRAEHRGGHGRRRPARGAEVHPARRASPSSSSATAPPSNRASAP